MRTRVDRLWLNRGHVRPIVAALAALAALDGGPCLAQQVTLTRIIGEGDVLPDGLPWGGAGVASIEGDRIAFLASRSEGGAICSHDIPTRDLRIIADFRTDSATYPGNTFKTFSNPAIIGNDVVFPAAALLFTGEWEGLYHAAADGSGGVSVVVDELMPPVRIPALPMISEAGVIYRDRGYAGEPVYFTTLSGAITPVARRGDPAPGGGEFFEMAPPVIGGSLAAFRAIVNTATTTRYTAVAWDAGAGELMRIVQEGDPIPGPAAPFDFVDVADSDGQRVLVWGRDDGFPSAYTAIYAWDGSELELLVETGEPIPGAGGVTFDWLRPIALDGDVMIFLGDDRARERYALFAHVRGSLVEVISNDEVLEGAPIWNFNVSARALSGNRAVINVGLDSRGRDAIYLAEIDGGYRSDLDGDGELTFFDFLAFQNLFAAGDPRAEFTGDGMLDFFDFLAFQNEFAAGCA